MPKKLMIIRNFYNKNIKLIIFKYSYRNYWKISQHALYFINVIIFKSIRAKNSWMRVTSTT